MRKASTYAFAGAIGIGSLLTLGGNASAVDLTSKLQARNLFGGDVASFKTSYDAESDVTTLETTIYLNDTAIKNILSQRSGEGSQLGSGYLELKPNIDESVTAWRKQNAFFAAGSDINEEKAKIDELLAKDESTKDYDTVCPFGARVFYKNSEGNFVKVPGDGDGHTSVEDAIRSSLGVDADYDLVYGEDFKIGMFTNYEWLYGWLDDNNVDAQPVYVLDTYKVTYPIAGVIASGVNEIEVYYKDLTSALAGEESKVIVREDVTLPGDLVVPEGKTLEIAEGATIALPRGASVSGTITGAGKITIGGVDYEVGTVFLSSIEIPETVTLAWDADEYMLIEYNEGFSIDNIDGNSLYTNIEYKSGKEGSAEVVFDGIYDGGSFLSDYSVIVANATEVGTSTWTVKVTDVYGHSASADIQVVVEDALKDGSDVEVDSEGNTLYDGYASFEEPVEGGRFVSIEAEDLSEEALAEINEDLKIAFDIAVKDEDGNVVEVKDNEVTVTLGIRKELLGGEFEYFQIVFIEGGEIAEYIDPVKVEDDGWGYVITFKTTHFSSYGVLASDTAFESAEDRNAALTPDTGAFTRETGSNAFGAVIVAAMVGLAVSAATAFKFMKR